MPTMSPATKLGTPRPTIAVTDSDSSKLPPRSLAFGRAQKISFLGGSNRSLPQIPVCGRLHHLHSSTTVIWAQLSRLVIWATRPNHTNAETTAPQTRTFRLLIG